MMREMASGVDSRWKSSTIVNSTGVIVMILLLQISIGLYTHKLLRTIFQKNIHERIRIEKAHLRNELKLNIQKVDFGNHDELQMYRRGRSEDSEEIVKNICTVVRENCMGVTLDDGRMLRPPPADPNIS
uniref:Uncharacterized protein n=1 Tax=Photinus pyralis TaxID=7054 RepID=A0A1Y1MQM8_PHOPY